MSWSSGMIYMEKEVQGRSNNSLTSFRLENASYILHFSPFILKSYISTKEVDFKRDVEIKMKHGHISPQMSHFLWFQKSTSPGTRVFSKECVDHALCWWEGSQFSFGFFYKQRKSCFRGYMFCHARFWKMQWLCRNRNILHQTF